jgi:hypothetical protein
MEPGSLAHVDGPDRCEQHVPAEARLCAGFQSRKYAMSILIGILVTFLVVVLILYLINMLPIEGRAKQIAQIIVIIIGILSLLKYLGVWL